MAREVPSELTLSCWPAWGWEEEEASLTWEDVHVLVSIHVRR